MRAFVFVFALIVAVTGVDMAFDSSMALHDATRARDWILVKAQPVDSSTYRYAFRGSTYDSKRLVPGHRGETGDDWLIARENFEELFRQKATFTVFVNPEAPREALVSREADMATLWTKLVGGVVLAAAGIAGFVWWDRQLIKSPRPARATMVTLWLFTALWSGLLLLIALGAVLPPGDPSWSTAAVLATFGGIPLWAMIRTTLARRRAVTRLKRT
jgi:hypothetical protein